MAAVAEMAGVSKATVSLALANSPSVGAETAKRIRVLAAELGYKTPRERKSKVGNKGAVGVLLDREFDWVGEQFFTRIIRSLHDEAERDGVQTIFAPVSRESMDAGRLPEVFRGDLVSSIVVVGITQQDFIRSLEATGKPVVLASGGTQVGSDFDCVLNDDFQGMEKLIRYLTELGHRKIALIGGRLEHLSNLERFRAFRVYTEELAGGYNPSLVHVASADASISYGRLACNALLTAGAEFTALVCMTDDMAYGAIEQLKRHGLRVPDDVSVSGFNDLAWSEHADPPLTSVRICCEELGQAVYGIVKTRLSTSGITHALRLMVGTNLIVRGSTGSVRQQAMRNADAVGAPLNLVANPSHVLLKGHERRLTL